VVGCPGRPASPPFPWSWAIPLISVFLSLADFAYLMALREPDAMISVAEYPDVVREVDPFAAARTAQHEERHECQ